MNKFTKLTIIALTSIAISACGGSSNRNDTNYWAWWGMQPGEGDEGENGGGNKPTPINHPNVTDIPTSTITNLIAGQTGEITIVDGNNVPHTVTLRKGSGDTLHEQGTLRVWHQTRNSYDSSLKHTIYGLADFGYNNATPDWHGFAQGDRTDVADMPTVGTVNYTGRAIATYDKSLENSSSLINDVDINVDFGNAKLNGLMADISLSADIIDAQFQGTAARTDGSDSANLFGQFNGPQAVEMTGTYESERADGMLGSFGAIAK